LIKPLRRQADEGIVATMRRFNQGAARQLVLALAGLYKICDPAAVWPRIAIDAAARRAKQ